MPDGINLPVILVAALLASGSPGPSNLAIAGTSMKAGRKLGLALASGIMTGSLIWSAAAACGLGAIMLANAWVLEGLRYFATGYLLLLAFKSAKSACTPDEARPQGLTVSSVKRAYVRGLALHLTNPKAILFFVSVYSLAVPATASVHEIALVVVAVGIQSFVIFHGYALLFSIGAVVRGYMRARRWFEAAFAVAFGAAGVKILAAKLQS
jgi:threonine efflux protein